MQQISIYLNILRHKWWVVSLTALFALNVTLVFLYFETPLYQAKTTFVISPGPSLLESTDQGDVVNGINALDRRSIIATYAEIMASQRVYEVASAALQLDQTVLLDYSIKAVVLPEASLVELTVTGPDPEIAVRLANGVGEIGITYIQDLYQIYNISILDAATPPTAPISPEPARSVAVALFLGLVVGSGLVILGELLREARQTYSSEEQDSPPIRSNARGMPDPDLPTVTVNSESNFKRGDPVQT